MDEGKLIFKIDQLIDTQTNGSMAKFYRRVDIARNTVREWKRGKLPSCKHLEKILRTFPHLDVTDLLEWRRE